MLVIPTADGPNATSEVFVMGLIESLSIANSQYRLNMTVLNDISLVINSQNSTSQTVVLHKDWVPNENRSSCTICSRKFHFISRRRHHCRMCGDVICKTCYVNRSAHQEETGKSRGVRSPAICQTKFCLRCVMGLRTADKRLENFSPQVSKMLSINVDTLDMSATETFEEFLELDSPDSNPRASSFFFTYYKNTQDEIDTSHRTDVEFAWNTMADRVKPRAAVTSRGIGSLISYGSGKLMRISIHSSSFTRLRGLSRLSRRSPTASIQPTDLSEQNMIINSDELDRIMVI